MKRKRNFDSIDALKPVANIINEATEALKDSKRIILNSPIADVLAGALGVGIGGAGSFAALFYGGTVVGLSAAGISSGLAAAGTIVGGGMAAGIAVLAAPAVVLGGLGVYAAKSYREKKLKQEKERLYQEALRKNSAIIRELRNEAALSKERADYLHSLNILLQRAINDLKEDLGYA